LISLADQRATKGPLTTARDQRHHEKICMDLVHRFFQKRKEKPFIRLINGDDLIEQLKLTPSPLFAKILREVEEQQVIGKIKTKQEALLLASKIAQK
jgi:poly(A) polymerase